MIEPKEMMDRRIEYLFEKDASRRGYKGSDYIVLIRYKYSFEKEWTEEKVIMTYYGDNDEYCYETDWWEGQQECELLGYILVDDIEIPLL